MKSWFLFCISMPVFSTLYAQSKSAQLGGKIIAFDQYAAKEMQQWQIPGMAIAIVRNNEIIYSKGFGIRKIGSTEKVDTKTYFSCASTTKAMTATCMGILVDEGKVQWNDPVQKFLPEFMLSDPYVTRELTIADLFIHNTGVGNTDFLWSENSLSEEEILSRMKLVKPAYSFRGSFIYQNIFYLVAGKVIEKIAGKPWHVFIKERIFDPLAMYRTKAVYKQVNDENHAYPHFFADKKITVIDKSLADGIGPAGSVSSCADDIALWMKCILDSSKYNNGRLVKPATWNYLFKPKTLVPESQFYPTQYLTKPNFTTYAMGWFQQDYKGYKINYHTGSLAGEVAIHAQLPDKKFGIYIFANLDHAELRHALVFKAFDLFELGGTTDWSSSFKKLYDSLQNIANQKDSLKAPRRQTSTFPTQKLENYAGLYENELYGTLHIGYEKEKLTVLVNNILKGELTHFHFDVFKVIYVKKQYPPEYYIFQLNASGNIEYVQIDGILFARKR